MPPPHFLLCEWGYLGCGVWGNDTTFVNFYYILASSHFFENTHAILSNFPCDTKSIKKLGAGDTPREGE